MRSLPVIHSRTVEDFTYEEGKLFRLPPELSGTAKIKAYSRFRRPGWHEIDFGFLLYSVALPDDVFLIFPGLNPVGSTQKGSFDKLRKRYTKDEFEVFVSDALEFEEKARKRVLSDFEILVHDLRGLSTAIYHAAIDAKTNLDARNFIGVEERIDNIIGSQSMLKLRTDLLDYSGNPNADLQYMNVPVYRRTHKVVKSFMPFAAKKSIHLHIRGTSYSGCYGPEAFEIIPYVLIDNAIKYSPNNSQIQVNAIESTESISFTFSSLGPNIEPHERSKIFDKNYRSPNASKAGVGGSGIGLYLASQLVERFKGKIEVDVGKDAYSSSRGEVHDIVFRVTLPISKQ